MKTLKIFLNKKIDIHKVNTLNDSNVNNIPEVKKLLKGFKIVNFSVKRDNKKQGLGDGTKKNAGGNKLREFDYTIEPDI